MKKVYFKTLGCSKNDVDTSVMSARLQQDHYEIVYQPEEADVIVVNTCGFIDDAKEESIAAIFEMARYKEQNLQKLVLAGCLAQRYPKELMEEIPEVDGILGTGNMRNISQLLEEIEDKRTTMTEGLEEDYLEEKRLEYHTTEYVKISEGCDNNCTYCIIPKLRGRNRSRKIEDIVREVKDLVAHGTREVILIAQNSTDYGIDLYGRYALADLLKALSPIEGLHWIRVMYLYPDHFTEDLIECFQTLPNLLPYVDIPLQHVADPVLKKMNRKTDREAIVHLLKTLRERVPNITIRTTFILGFPGETEEDFHELLQFIQDHPFDKLGAFTYSREEGTPAYKLDHQVEEEVKEQRKEDLMLLQQGISAQLLKERIGSVLEVLVEEKLQEGLWLGRSVLDAPEIDGVVYVYSDQELEIGSFYEVEIQDTMEYDMVGQVLRKSYV